MNEIIQVQHPLGPAYAIFNTTRALYYVDCYKHRDVADDMAVRVNLDQGQWVSSIDDLIYCDQTSI